MIYEHTLLSILQDGVTSLMWASNNGHTDTVKVLLDAKADFNITDNVRLQALCIIKYYDVILIVTCTGFCPDILSGGYTLPNVLLNCIKTRS